MLESLRSILFQAQQAPDLNMALAGARSNTFPVQDWAPYFSRFSRAEDCAEKSSFPLIVCAGGSISGETHFSPRQVADLVSRTWQRLKI